MLKSILSALIIASSSLVFTSATLVAQQIPCDEADIPQETIDEVEALVASREEGRLALEADVAAKRIALDEAIASGDAEAIATASAELEAANSALFEYNSATAEMVLEIVGPVCTP